ncbi:MAG: serine/threonine-protein kinase, partial [Marmoricola sp.]
MLKQVAGYQLISELGEGGMGVVYLARNRAGEHVALKALRPHLADEEARERMSREASSLSRVRSPRVADVLDADPWGAAPFVVTRYIDGLSLTEDVREHGAYAEDDLRELAIGIAEALAAVHAVGVLHRDVKPGNVLIGPDGPVLIDFGLALTAEDPKLTATGYLLGTPGYLAPEVLYGDPPTTATDVHSWAATVAFAATGRGPAGKGPAMAIMDRVRRGEFDLGGVPASMLPLIQQGLDPEPERRPSLEQILARLGGTIPMAPAPEPRFQPEPTRVLPADPSLLTADPSLLTGEPSVLRGGRFRQSVGLLGLGLGAAGLVSAAPYVGAVALAITVMLLRFASVTSERHRWRSERRGERRWYDSTASAIASPSYFVSSLGGTLALLGVAAVLTALIVLIVAVSRTSTDNGLLLIGLVVVASLWWGPGSMRVRRVARSWTLGWTTADRTWLIVVAVGIAIYGCA